MSEPVVGTLQSAQGCMLETRLWIPQGEPRGVVQLVHGMAEHIRRYDATAAALNQAGFVAVGLTSLGHGEQAELLGWFAPENGWTAQLEDVHALRTQMQAAYPGLPYFLMGHSMGSFIVRNYCQTHEAGLSGVILSGTGHIAPVVVNAGLLIANLQCLFGMEKKPSALLQNMSFGSYNKAFEPARTAFDWLSKDTENVDRYIADPLCGYAFTAGGYRDFFRGLRNLNPKNLRTMEKDVPIRLFSGANDPVGACGEGVKATVSELKAAGIADVTYQLYEGGRHEMLNETERETVWADLVKWLEAKLA